MSLTSKISREKLDALIQPHQTDRKVLDVGAFGMPRYAKYFSDRTGLDIKEGPGVDVVGSVYAMPFGDESFDVVLCLSVLEHLESPQKAITEMKRVLKSGGKIIVSVPFLFPIHDAPGDYWRFTKFGLRNLFSEWDIQELRAETDTQESIAVLLQRVGYQSRLKLNAVLKTILFLAAKILARLPNMVERMYGDIHKHREEPEAFASAFFMAAVKK